ncbi:TonB-linked outer membrane protein, SusC/RagA family [Porphyromonadaceae bacterium KH3R12]|nr:TonB-linked outer membrane protein, SusC/RagA family [Porphyromonadaceae bacterium KH3R12]
MKKNNSTGNQLTEKVPIKHFLLIMRMTFILLFICAFCSMAETGYTQNARVTINKRNTTLKEVLNEIESQTDYLFIYNNEVNTKEKVSIRTKQKAVSETLNTLLKDKDVSYSMEGNHIILSAGKSKDNQEDILSTIIQQQKKKISGTVMDTHGIPIIGANIVEMSENMNGTITDMDGNFLLEVEDNAILRVSYIGYLSQEINTAGKTTFSIILEEDTKTLDEVVVTALGVKREEKSLGYAVQNVSGSSLQTVKGVDMTASLTGKVAGLTIKNSTEFNARAGIEMRGETPLLVINGVPYGNMSLRDIPADEIEDITTLKGATAAALYGSRGSAGAIMITTKGGKEKGLSVEFNSNTMFRAGWVAIPKAQTSYGHGLNGEIADDYVWGPKLDIGNTALQWNPVTKQEEEMPLVSSGKNNFRNFLESGLITNNSISVTQTGENGFFRTNLNYVYNKGQYPNQKLDMINYTLSGEMKLGDKFSVESQMGYMRSTAPQIWGGGYGNQGYIYQILMWTGPDYDIRQYRDYWVTPHEKQNWLYSAWYDNPYLIAYEKLYGQEENKLNASLTMNYNILKDLKLIFRNGYDFYKNEDELRNPAGVYSTRGPSVSGVYWDWSGKGMYGINQRWGYSLNSDLMLSYNKTLGKFDFDLLGGGSIYYYQDRNHGARTMNGLAVPGWYSLANAIPSTAVGVNSIQDIYGTYARQVNSVYGKLSVAWNNAVYLDVTGRNDWSSTQPVEERSYFYPSVAGSVVLSEFFNTPSWLGMWKVRGSWTIAKSPLGVYDNNLPYSISNSWGYLAASYPSNLMGANLLPSETRTWEIGSAAYFFGKRLYVDFAYFDKLYYNRQIKQDIAPSSGFSTTLINTAETYARRGVEITVSGDIISNKDFKWNSMLNYSYQHRYYVDIDPVYSKKDQWTQPGKRLDYYAATEKALRDPQGNIIHSADGNVWLSSYNQLYGYRDPNFTFGFINTLTYHDWTLNISIDGRIGGMMDNYIYGKMFDTGSAPETDTEYRYDEVMNGAKYIGQGVKVIGGSVSYDTDGNILEDTRQYAPNDIPVSYQEYMRLWGNSWEGRIHDQTFIKLRELSVTYNLPAKLIHKTFINNASVSLTGQNLFLWTKDFKYSDPDIGKEDMNAPSQRMIGFNIKLGF